MNAPLLTLLAATLLAAGPALKPADSAPPAQNKVTITVKGDKRIIESNGIPDHPVAAFPNRGNPNAIAEQKYRLEVPAHPQPATAQPGRFPYAWGVALNGVVFDPGTAEVYNDGDRSNPWRYEALKSNTEMGTTPGSRSASVSTRITATSNPTAPTITTASRPCSSLGSPAANRR